MVIIIKYDGFLQYLFDLTLFLYNTPSNKKQFYDAEFLNGHKLFYEKVLIKAIRYGIPSDKGMYQLKG